MPQTPRPSITNRNTLHFCRQTNHKSCHKSDDIGDGVDKFLVPGEHVYVSEHSSVYQRPQQEVHMTHQHQPQTHLHQDLIILQTATTNTYKKHNIKP